MHMAAYEALGMDHTYGAIRATAQDLPRLVEALRAGAYDGFNVTVPHKQRVLELVDDVGPVARAIGAANTLTRPSPPAPLPQGERGRVAADNTDAPALAIELQRLAPERSKDDWARSTAIVLGSGGASRAALAALSQLGVIDVITRARRGDPLVPTARDREVLTVIQATSAGMHGADPGGAVALACAWRELPDAAIALDVIYAPPETPFLAAARARGLRHANGLGMLVEQGALAFERWLGVPAPRDVMLAAIR
jgi:shikimate dehydrogenase